MTHEPDLALQAVLRDLAWLFNATNLAAAQELEEFPLASRSVVNYGLPELAGQTLSGADLGLLERSLRETISDFEPRLLRNTLKIRAVTDKREMARNAITFEIEGQLWAQPAPEHLLLKTQVDLESGDVTVHEAA